MFTPEMMTEVLIKSSQYEQNGFQQLAVVVFYLFFVVRFGDARFRDDFAGVNVPRRQVRQFVHARESSLFKHKKKFKSINSKFNHIQFNFFKF